MNKRKVLLTALALVLVCAMSVMGTVAFMKLNTGAVTNTFLAAGGGKLADAMSLTEHTVTEQEDGSYTIAQGAATTNANSYNAMPGMVLPKDPTITITGKSTAPAYLYLEVVGQLSGDYVWNLENHWKPLMNGQAQATGNHGGKLYVYQSILNQEAESATYSIIQNNQITVKADAASLTHASTTLTFYAYLAQANVGENSTELSVYNTCFPSGN